MLHKKVSLHFVLILYLFTLNCQFDRSEKRTNQEQHENSNKVEVAFTGKLKVLTLNTWHEGTKVSGGVNAIAEVIAQTNADIVALSEIMNNDNTVFSSRIVEALKTFGKTYHSFNSGKSPIILSKFPMVSEPILNSPYLVKCVIKLTEDKLLTMYSAHLDYTHYACYLPRGYDGITWGKLPEPVTDLNTILEQNLGSNRDEAIDLFVNNAKSERNKGNMVILAGDFNEPSHLDWIEETKNLFDHNGTVVPWQNSSTLQTEGYLDAYRVKYPNPVTHPGFTWPAFNTLVPLSKLVWAPDADDRDRIDFVYYNDDAFMSLDDIIIVGLSGSIVRGEGIEDTEFQDKFLLTKGVWPSDHKGILATFKTNSFD
ncbi:endonuclease/exonuclease/phosphatase family protein [Seonamhaeicola sp.]|uniref:endonuclease/exonuclease/phosphatase family protein n=1 Tax=Seonamhaeicola sp. TaxID=1912245 RepID=UPI002628EA33|nr:endonuclease/exonuclease/phosphatase family protein [Seonamhaeicola sp.]